MKQDLSGKDGDRRWRRDYRGSDSLGGPRERNFNRFRGSRGGGFGGPRESRFGGGDGGGFRDGGFRGGSRGGGFRGRGFGEFRGERRDEEDVDNRRLFESLTDPTEVPKLGNFFEVWSLCMGKRAGLLSLGLNPDLASFLWHLFNNQGRLTMCAVYKLQKCCF